LPENELSRGEPLGIKDETTTWSHLEASFGV
jgi:hypothetical protein